MPGFHLYKSNRLEALARALAAATSDPLRSVLQPEMIIVQSLGMRRWLSQTLAGLHGVSMNCEFPFPADFIRRVFKAAFPDLEEDRAFDRALLPWRILKHLPAWLKKPAFEELAHYLQGDSRPVKEFQLAQKIAAVFDSYLAYRPEWILEWQAKRGKEWQPELWRALTRGHEETHSPALARRLLDQLSQGKANLSRMPERISIFGISSLPPFHLSIIAEVSKHLDVHFFHLDPTDLYWGDVQSAKEQDRALRRLPKSALSVDDLNFDAGNPLLSSMGKAGRDFSRLLVDIDAASETSLFQDDAAPRNLLAHLQADIFHLESGSEPADFIVAPDDHSIQVHCCHSPMRELEVLHDQLLALFDADLTLTPRDILVTMPDVEGYAPFIDAVFGSPESAETAIPFSIADRSARTESTIADVFLHLIDLTGGRFGASTIFSLLETPAIQRRFSLEESDLPVLQAWARQTGIRWGIDAAHRASLDQPEFADNTWRAGLRRLLLGYALPGDGQTLFDDILPVREVEGALAATLGHFVDFAESLFDHVRELETARSPAEWERALRSILDAFFSDDDEFTDELHRIRNVLEGLGEAEREADFHAAVEFPAIREHLISALEDTDSGVGFLAGSVTFCALKPMRSIPFKVICMLGMNDTAFPRHASPPAFDLAAAQPRAGDRNLRDDDRHLFLETLLSARDALYISYTGISNRSNKESPPCAPVGELLDYLDTRFPPPVAEGTAGFRRGREVALPPSQRSAGVPPASPSGSGGALLSTEAAWRPMEKVFRRDLIVRKHRLQPFSSAYFQREGALFSYSKENCRACEQARAPRQTSPLFAPAPLSEPEGEWRELDWETLIKFFGNPSRYFARERLSLRLPSDTASIEDCEPQTLDRLARFGFEEGLVHDAMTREHASEGALKIARATGSLPPGYPGDSEYKTLSGNANSLAKRIQKRIEGEPLAPISVDLPFGEWKLTGALRDVYPAALLRYRSAKVKPKHLLSAWIAHLVLQCIGSGPKNTMFFGSDSTVTFRPLRDPKTVLGDLIELYAGGLRSPLPFFPESSYAFAKRTIEPTNRTELSALEAARLVWLGSDFTSAECDDPWHQVCFRGREDVFDDEWQKTALRIFEPLLAHRSEEKV